MLKRIAFGLSLILAHCGRVIASDDKPESAPQANPSAATESEAAPAHTFNGPRDVLVKGRITVDIMQIAAPPRANELALRMKQAISQNPDWFLEYAKQRKPGEPLPYDERIGLSKEEYDEFLKLSKQLSMQKAAEATLTVTMNDDSVFVLDGGEALPELTGIKIDLKADEVTTPFGTLTDRSKIDAPEDTALGAWVGVQWKLSQPDPNGLTGVAAKLAVGKLKQSGRCVIYYDVRKVSAEGATRISHVLNYDLP